MHDPVEDERILRQVRLEVEYALPLVGTHIANCEAPEVMRTLDAKSAAAASDEADIGAVET